MRTLQKIFWFCFGALAMTNLYIDASQMYIPGSSGGGYATVQDEEAALTQRTIVDFQGTGVACADNTVSKTICTVNAGAGSPAGANYQLQFYSGGSFSGATYATATYGYLLIPEASEPSTTQNGIQLFSEKRGDYNVLAMKGYQGGDSYAQHALWGKTWGLVSDIAATAGTTAPQALNTTATATGTVSHPTPSAWTGSNFAATLFRTRLTSVTSQSIQVGYSGPVGRLYRGDASAVPSPGGFLWEAQFGRPVYNATDKLFVGLNASIGMTTFVTATAFPNMAAFVTEESGTTWKFCTSAQVAANNCQYCPPATYLSASSTTAFYAVMITSAPSTSSISYFMKRKDIASAPSCSGTVSTVASIPQSTVPLNWHIRLQKGRVATTTAIDLFGTFMYHESDY